MYAPYGEKFHTMAVLVLVLVLVFLVLLRLPLAILRNTFETYDMYLAHNRISRRQIEANH